MHWNLRLLAAGALALATFSSQEPPTGKPAAEPPKEAAPAPERPRPPPPGPWGLVSQGKYLAALALAEQEHEKSPKDPRCCDQLGIMRSFVGDDRGALEVFESMGGGAAAIDLAELGTLEACEPRDALTEIVAAVHGRPGPQVVILNEAHHVPMHRAFSVQLARALRSEGFEWFAAETFTRDTDALRERGWPTQASGFYSAEPTFGSLIREALALGYKPVAYETESFAQGGDSTDGINHRETEQSRHLIERIFRDHPDARVFVHVGYSHATEDWRKLPDGRDLAWMAARLKRELGIDPVTIDQTEQMPASTPERATAAWQLARKKGWLDQPVVLRRTDGGFFVGGLGWRGKVDLQVFHPEPKLVDGRPDWMTRDGRRQPIEVPAELEPAQGRVLVQAFVASESDDAIPADQVVLLAGEPAPVLLLPEGEFRLIVQDESGNVVARQPLVR